MAEPSKDELDLDVNAEAENAPTRSKKSIFIIVGILVLLVGGAFGYFATQMLTSSDGETVDKSTVLPLSEKPIYYAFEKPFIVNFQSDGQQRSRFAQIDVTVVTKRLDVPSLLEEHMPLIRNDLLLLFSNQTYTHLSSIEGKEALRKQALDKIQNIVVAQTGQKGIDNILFTKFVMQ